MQRRQDIKIGGSFTGSLTQIISDYNPLETGRGLPRPPEKLCEFEQYETVLRIELQKKQADIHIYGMSGTGKTALISSIIAERIKKRKFKHERLCYVDLGSGPAVSEIDLALLLAPQLPLKPQDIETLTSNPRQFFTYWRQHAAAHFDCVVIDNLQDADLRELLKLSTDIYFITIGHSRISDAGCSINLVPWNAGRGLSLVEHLAHRRKYTITKEEGRRLVDACDGLPLAITVATNLVCSATVLCADDVTEALNSAISPSQSWDKRVVQRLRSCIGLLDAETRRSWLALVSFEGSFFEFQAECIFGQTQCRPTLERLVENSLCLVADGEAHPKFEIRFRIHDLLKQVASTFAQDNSYPGEVSFAESIFRTAIELNWFYKNRDDVIIYANAYHTIKTNFESAYEILTDNLDTDERQLLLVQFPIQEILALDTPPEQRLAWLDRVRPIAERKQNHEEIRELLLRIDFETAKCLIDLSRSEEALIAIDRARTNAEGWDASQFLPALEGTRTMALLYTAQYKEAFNSNKRAYRAHREIGDRSGQATSLAHRGQLYLQFGMQKRAIKFYEAALAIETELEDEHAMAKTLQPLSLLYNQNWRMQEALDAGMKGLEIAEKIGDKQLQIDCNSAVGHVAYKLGIHDDNEVTRQENISSALAYFDHAQKLAETIGRPSQQIKTLIDLGGAQQEDGSLALAEENYWEAIAVAKEAGVEHMAALAYNNVARLQIMRDEMREAEVILEDGLQGLTDNDRFHDRKELHHTQAVLYTRLGQTEKARLIYKGIKAEAEKLGWQVEVERVDHLLGMLDTDRG